MESTKTTWSGAIFCMALVFPALPARASDQVTFDVVAIEGEPAPGTGGEMFMCVDRPATINDAGDVLFWGAIAVPCELGVSAAGIWVGRPGDLQLVAQTGDAVPGTDDLAFGTLFGSYNRLLSNTGDVFLAPTLNDGSGGLWAGPPGALVPVPNAAASAAFGYITQTSANTAGTIVFVDAFQDTTPQFGAWRIAGEIIEPIMMSGDAVPGVPGATVRNVFPRIQPDGEILLTVEMTIEGGTQSSALYRGQPGDFTLLGFTPNSFEAGCGAASTNGDVVFYGRQEIGGIDRLLISRPGAAVQPIELAGAGLSVSHVNSIDVGPGGRVVMSGEVGTQNADFRALAVGDPAEPLDIVVAEGMPFPGEADRLIDDVGRVRISPAGTGRMMFFVGHNTPIEMLVRDARGGLHRGLCEGDLIDGRTVVSVEQLAPELYGGGLGQSGRQRAWNVHEEILLHARFDDGAVGIVVARLGDYLESDVDGDRDVDVDDLIAVITAWGECPGESACPADITADGEVDVDDLVQVILGW